METANCGVRCRQLSRAMVMMLRKDEPMKRVHNPSIRGPSSLPPVIRGIDRQFLCGGAVPVIPAVPAEPDLGDGIHPALPPAKLAHQPAPGLEERNAQ